MGLKGPHPEDFLKGQGVEEDALERTTNNDAERGLKQPIIYRHPEDSLKGQGIEESGNAG